MNLNIHSFLNKFLWQKVLPKSSLARFVAVFMMLSIIFVVITFFVIKSVPFIGMDNTFTDFLFSVRTPFLAHVFYIITSFANQATIISLSVITLCYLYFKKETNFSYALVFIIVGTEITLQLMKFLINRPRPTPNIAYYIEKSSSFPSGHSATAVAFFGFMLYYLTKHIANQNKKALVLFFGAALIILIGFSRMYLGVHFLSDVIGGFAMGGLWLLLGIAFHKKQTGAFRPKKEQQENCH